MEITEEEEGSEVPLVPLLRPGSHPEVRVRDIESEKPQANTRPRKNEFEPYLHGDIANISQYTATNVEYAKRPTKIQKIEKADTLDVPSLIQKTPYDYDDLFMPEWFDRSSIHRLEALSIPEINDEDCSLTPDDYIAIRNYMIDAYRASPAYYLTISTCTSKLETDLPILVRIHSFLEMYGLINSHVDPRRRIYDPYIDTDPNAELKPKSQRNFADIDKADMQYLRDLIYKHDSSGHSHWKLSVEDPKNSDRRRIFICCTCRTDCSAVRYQSLKAKDYQVCIDCFLEGRYSAVYSSADFLRVEGTGGSAELEMDEQQPWSDQEILRLLEGVDRYDDDWLMISEHVGSRSKEQCITQFLQLPINDEFLTATLSEEELVETPFDDTTNPVMMMISFLAAHINPGIAAAASKAALKILIESDETNDSMDVNSTEDATKEKMDNIKTDEDDVYEESKIDDIKANNANKGVFSKETIRRATMGALNCAVQKAGKLADYEHQEIQHWTRLAVKTMVDKLSLKVGQYEELETSLLNEAQELEKQQSQIANSIEALRTPKDDHQQQLQQQDHNK
ncbi:hypothetical protein BDF20DRAFT_814875 [Mycotypha africana]|uniref:uncharacterized protein n=1 Tax=Mycotypha africana TaxID=64632 RepID=UPI0023009788|nr:uncharacterized protein BDF20DRAFT_814875 [Mycotypha africana]KAI8988171.1 hypothetical protein BDF20DRAFT_814875 [Mycotypha africana]